MEDEDIVKMTDSTIAALGSLSTIVAVIVGSLVIVSTGNTLLGFAIGGIIVLVTFFLTIALVIKQTNPSDSVTVKQSIPSNE